MEVVISGSDNASKDSFFSITDLHSGAHIHTLKQTSAACNSITLTADSILVAQNDRAIINVYKWHKEAVDQKLILAEKLCSLCSSHDQRWLLGGSDSGKLYLWEIASGSLVFVKEAHYLAITSLCFSKDDKIFVSGSKDTNVFVWSMTEVLNPDQTRDLIRPSKEFKAHTLAITQLYISTGNHLNARLFTASLDQSLRIWDLATGEAISTILFPSPITSLLVDPAERHVFAGTQSGIIYEHKMYKQEKTLQAVGGHGNMIETSKAASSTLEGHESAVTALCSSLDGNSLVSGSQDGSTFVWDVITQQMKRKLKQQPGCITSLLVTRRTPITHEKQHTQFQPLKRVREDQAEHNIYVKLPVTAHSLYQPMDDLEAVKYGLAQFNVPVAAPATQELVNELQSELQRVYKGYNELKEKHEKLEREYIESLV